MSEQSRLLLIGAGSRPYREYVLQSLQSHGYEVVLLADERATWAEPYVLEHVPTRFEPGSVTPLAARLHRRYRFDGVMTYGEARVELAAEVAEALGLPGLSRSAARVCRDKAAMRAAFAAAGVPSARSTVVHEHAAALAAAEEIGYPVVLKPRALAGSMGVIRADSPRELKTALAVALSARHPNFPGRGGVLVEEYLEGPEFSVESVVHDRRVMVFGVTAKHLGFAPSFEEVGHVTRLAGMRPDDERIIEAVDAAHTALGITCGASHTEIRLTPRGPRLVEVAARLGGDLIPRLVHLATGIDMASATAAALTGRLPDVLPTRNRAAGIRFIYPPADGVVRRLATRSVDDPPWLSVEWLAGPGEEVQVPPRRHLSRLGHVIALGRDDNDCIERLDRSERLLDIGVDVRRTVANDSLRRAS